MAGRVEASSPRLSGSLCLLGLPPTSALRTSQLNFARSESHFKAVSIKKKKERKERGGLGVVGYNLSRHSAITL